MTLPRFHIQGHIYYITTNVYQNLPLFKHPTFIIPLIDSLNYYRYKYRFKILGYVIMPDHIHLIVWPQDQPAISEFMRDFKKFTAVRLIRQAEVENASAILQAFANAGEATKRCDHKIWQDSYWDTNIFTERFLRQKLHYIHRNPVRANLVANPAEYPYSSYRNYALNDESLIAIDRDWS